GRHHDGRRRGARARARGERMSAPAAVGRAEEVLRDRITSGVRSEHPLAPLTTFRIGGPAALFLEPDTEQELAAVAEALEASGLPLAVLGKGSNVLISDRGFPGIVLRLGKGFRWSRRDGSRLHAGASMPLPALAGVATAAEDIRGRMDEAREWRRRTQPLAEPNCGSVFVNPPGDHAARLIEAAGGKKLSVGAAHVAEKHANFIVTSEGARATDVIELIGKVQDLVAARFDVHLETEVHLVGDFDPATA